MNILTRLFPPKPALYRLEIVVESDGFRLKENGILGDLWKWANQEEIMAKMDGPVIWMKFLIPGDDDYLYISEEVPGFEELMLALKNRLPSFDWDWREKVNAPEAAMHGTVVYKNEESTL